jgi:AraC-like DNA-binding protein
MDMTSRNKTMTPGCNEQKRATVAAGFARAFLDFAVSKGAEKRQLLERSRICSDHLAEPDNRVPFANYNSMMEAAIEMCDEPALALQFGEAVRLKDISILGHVGHAETAEQARQQANRYRCLAVDDGNDQRLEFVPEDGNVWLKFAGVLYSENQLFTESVLARCVCDGRACDGTRHNKRWPRPKAIRFTHAEPSYRAEYDRIFDMPLEFNSSMNAVMFGEELLSVRVAPPNEYISRLVNREAEALLQRLDNSTMMRGRVEELLMPMLHTGTANVEIVAGKLGVSRQTLFRKLKTEGVTFEEILDSLRYKMALRFLKDEKITVNETAYRVGFSDAAAFSRAFKRWSGASPGLRRKRIQ